MSWAKRIILMSGFLLGQKAFADSEYRINFGDDLWSSKLLEETCPQELKQAITQVIEHYSRTRDGEIVAVLPKELEYQYFRVEFKEFKNGMLIDLEEPLAYQFQYWTHRDEHNICVKVEAYNIAS